MSILLEVLGAQLYAPFSHPFGTVADRGDLEIGHISRQLDDDRSADPVARDLAYQLKEARNELAHLRPLRPAFFRHPAVVGHADRMETARREGRATIS